MNKYTAKQIPEGLILSSAKNSDTLIEQSKTKPIQTLEFKFTKTLDTISFEKPSTIEGEETEC